MTEFPILRDLGLILLAAAGVLLAARTVRVPPIVAYIVAGLALGPVTGLVQATEGVDLIAEVGIALLLFLVGLELSFERIRDVGRAALLAGGGQIALTAALGYGLAVLLGFRLAEAGLLALAVTFSSTVVVVKLLERRGELSALHGRLAVGILLVQDVVVAIALTLLAGLGDPTALDVGTLTRGLLAAFAGMAALVAAALVATSRLLPRLFRWLAGSLEALFIWSLTWCFAFIFAARTLGLSLEVGAFVAGVSLAQLPYNEELIRRVHPLVNFFLAVFFVSLGINLELGAAVALWPAMLALSLFVVAGKPLLLMPLIPRLDYGERTSFLTAITLGQISEFSFIVATLALDAGLVGQELLSLVGAVGLITIGVSAVAIENGGRLFDAARRARLMRLFGARPQRDEAAAPELRDHIIIVGMNTLGRLLAEALAARGERVLAVDVDAAKLQGLPCPTLQGNTEYPSILERANLAGAKLLVSALQIEDANNLLAYRARQAGIPSSIHAFDTTQIEELRDNGATHVMVSKHDGILQVVGALRQAGVID